MTVAVVVLAAGAGTRLGWGPKGALLTDDGRSLAQRAADAVREAGARPIVVTGAVDLEVTGAVLVHAHHWSGGLGESLRVGVEAAVGNASTIGVLLADQPGIGVAVVRRVLAAHRRGRITAAGFDGVRGHPVVMDAAKARAAVAEVHGDRGFGPHLTRQADRLQLVECADIGDPADIDTEEDALAWGLARPGPHRRPS